MVVGVGCRFFAMCWFEFVLVSVGFIGLKLDELCGVNYACDVVGRFVALCFGDFDELVFVWLDF